jgi:hypothetical protein
MLTDTLLYDSLNSRPLPKWLIDQKTGANTIQPQKLVMREDNSLKISFTITSVFLLLVLVVSTLYFLKKKKNE